MAKGHILTPDEARRTGAVVGAFEGKPVIGLDKRNPRRRRVAPICDSQNAKVQITVFGTPTGGAFDLTWNVDGTSGTPTFDFDYTATEVKTEMVATFSNISTAELTVTAGPFPDVTVELEFTGDLANTNIALPTADFSSLTGGAGVGVISSLSQLGIA